MKIESYQFTESEKHLITAALKCFRTKNKGSVDVLCGRLANESMSVEEAAYVGVSINEKKNCIEGINKLLEDFNN